MCVCSGDDALLKMAQQQEALVYEEQELFDVMELMVHHGQVQDLSVEKRLTSLIDPQPWSFEDQQGTDVARDDIDAMYLTIPLTVRWGLEMSPNTWHENVLGGVIMI